MSDNIKSHVNAILSEEWSNEPAKVVKLSEINKKAANRVYEIIKEFAKWSNVQAKFNKDKINFVEVEPLSFKKARDWVISDEVYALKDDNPELFERLVNADRRDENRWWTMEDGTEIPVVVMNRWTYGNIKMKIDFKKFWFNRNKNARSADKIREFAKGMINGVLGAVTKNYNQISHAQNVAVKLDDTTWMDIYYLDNGVPKLLDRNRPRWIDKNQEVTLIFSFEPIEVMRSGRGEFQGRDDFVED